MNEADFAKYPRVNPNKPHRAGVKQAILEMYADDLCACEHGEMYHGFNGKGCKVCDEQHYYMACLEFVPWPEGVEDPFDLSIRR